MDKIMTHHHRVLLIRNAYQKDTGGAEQYAFNLAKALKIAGHTPIVVTKHSAIMKKCEKEGIRSVKGIWHESQEWGKHYYLRFMLMPIWYCWLILRYRITVVHPQSRDDFVFATNAGALLRKTVVWTDHADLKYIMDRANRPHPRMQKWILNAARKAHAIICVSNDEKSSIIRVAPEIEPKLSVVYNGVFIPTDLHPVEKQVFVIGTNARLVPEKGIGELLEAFAVVQQKAPDIELWLVGGLSNNGDMYQAKAKELGIENNIKFVGYVPNPNDYLASMDIFVHASYHEAFSLAIIEACMLGLPIIATAVGGTPEIIHDRTGILIQPKDSSVIVKALNQLMANEQLRKTLAANAKKLAYDEFDFQKIVEHKIIPLYTRSQS